MAAVPAVASDILWEREPGAAGFHHVDAKLSLTGLHWVPAGQTVTAALQCSADGDWSSPAVKLDDIKLTAAEVGGYTVKVD